MSNLRKKIEYFWRAVPLFTWLVCTRSSLIGNSDYTSTSLSGLGVREYDGSTWRFKNKWQSVSKIKGLVGFFHPKEESPDKLESNPSSPTESKSARDINDEK